MTGDWVYWLGWLGMAALFAGMIYIVWRALFHDRARGKRRCPKCWHDLSHTPGMTCGECGHIPVSEAQLHKTRRRPLTAVGAIFVCVLAAGFVNKQMDQRGWASIAPTNVLIWTLPLSIDGRTFSGSELGRRMNTSKLSDSQWLTLLRRCANGDWWREPVDDEWEDTYGDILDQWARTLSRGAGSAIAAQGDTAEHNRQLLFQQQVDDILLNIPPKVLACTRPDWPSGASPRVDVTMREWWPREFESRLVLKPADGVEPVIAFRGSRFGGDVPFSLPVSASAASSMPDSLDVIVERRRPGEPWKPVWSARVPITIINASASATAMTAVQDESLDDAMCATFSPGTVRWTNGSSPVRFRVDLPATANARFEGIAIGAKVELHRDGVLARRLDLWWLAGLSDDRHYNFEIAYENITLLKTLGSDSATWTLTITGDEALAERAGPAAQLWNGAVEIPVTVTTQNGTAPPRPWFTQEQLDEERAGEYSALE